ncbi:hypothetical protein HAX54_052494 [Datura stramonium]|uniref:Peptidase C1A papain C-terminal domain-containing protein n=1 Tax=Datura stramonium TaxID=4076 RepID=A0ABS8SZZ7_DATST|nr:hypothetical protein [Datura stramonium]
MALRFSFLFLFSILLATSFLVSVNGDINAGDDDILIRQVVGDDDNHLLNADHHFTILPRFGKTYASDEATITDSQLCANLRRATRHQKLDPSAVHGVPTFLHRKLHSLREQQLVDCDHECDPEEKGSCDSGCNGGLMNSAFEYTLVLVDLCGKKIIHTLAPIMLPASLTTPRRNHIDHQELMGREMGRNYTIKSAEAGMFVEWIQWFQQLQLLVPAHSKV